MSTEAPPRPSAATVARSLPLVRRLVSEFLRPYLGILALALMCMGLIAGTTTANAWLMQPMLDKVFVAHDEKLLLIIPAAVVAYSRVYVGSHWPSDVAISYIMGIGMSLLLLAGYEALWQKIGPRWLPRLYKAHPTLA